MLPNNPRDTERVLLGGLVAGIVGGVAIAIFMMVVNLASGRDIWMVMKGAAMPLVGSRATVPGFDLWVVALGLVCHFFVSIAWSVPFALIVDGLTRGATVAAGALWGIVVWIAMFYVVLPIVGLWRVARGAPVGLAIVEHLVFGVATGLGYLPFQRTRARRVIRAY